MNVFHIQSPVSGFPFLLSLSLHNLHSFCHLSLYSFFTVFLRGVFLFKCVQPLAAYGLPPLHLLTHPLTHLPTQLSSACLGSALHSAPCSSHWLQDNIHVHVHVHTHTHTHTLGAPPNQPLAAAAAAVGARGAATRHATATMSPHSTETQPPACPSHTSMCVCVYVSVCVWVGRVGGGDCV